MDVEAEVVELRLLINDLKAQNKSICDALDDLNVAHTHTLKVLKLLCTDFQKRNDPGVEEIVRCMYG